MSNLVNFLQLIGGIVISVGYIPQIRQIIRTKSSEGLNLKSFGMIFFAVILYEIYAVCLVVYESSGHMFLVTNSLSMIFSGTMCLLIRIYREKENDSNENQ
ncbi:MAG: PQ-loop repeat-containing protein [Clostridia bacterium]|nr:PQ-loop repeat-containing protein [Clostridia bacterium]